MSEPIYFVGIDTATPPNTKDQTSICLMRCIGTTVEILDIRRIDPHRIKEEVAELSKEYVINPVIRYL